MSLPGQQPVFTPTYGSTLPKSSAGGRASLFTLVQGMGSEAESVYAACGGQPNAPTTVEQEHSFHTCW